MRRTVWPALILSRLWIAAFVYAGHFSHPFLEKIDGGYAGVANRWLNAWTTFDSEHFLAIAARGYTPKTAPFFPLYPLLLRPFGPDETCMALAGILISNACFALALWIFWRLTREIYGEVTARRAVWLLAFFPAGAFGMAVYTESLFLALALGAFWCARHRKWWPAALLVFGAALARNSGPILCVALLAQWLESRKTEPAPETPAPETAPDARPGTPLDSPVPETRLTAGALAAILAPALAFFLVQGYFRARFGAQVSSVSAQTSYFRAPMFPLLPIERDFLGVVSGRALDIVTLLNLSATVLAIWLLWRFRKTTPRGDAIFLGSVLLVHLTIARIIPPFTNGSLRYVFGAWPFTQLLARQVEVFFSNRARALAFCALYGLLCAVHSYLFGLKSFLG